VNTLLEVIAILQLLECGKKAVKGTKQPILPFGAPDCATLTFAPTLDTASDYAAGSDRHRAIIRVRQKGSEGNKITNLTLRRSRLRHPGASS